MALSGVVVAGRAVGRMDAVAIRTIDDYLLAMKTSFEPSASGNRSLVLQYEFTGREQGICHAAIAAGEIQVARGPHPAPLALVPNCSRVGAYFHSAYFRLSRHAFAVQGGKPSWAAPWKE